MFVIPLVWVGYKAWEKHNRHSSPSHESNAVTDSPASIKGRVRPREEPAALVSLKSSLSTLSDFSIPSSIIGNDFPLLTISSSDSMTMSSTSSQESPDDSHSLVTDNSIQTILPQSTTSTFAFSSDEHDGLSSPRVPLSPTIHKDIAIVFERRLSNESINAKSPQPAPSCITVSSENIAYELMTLQGSNALPFPKICYM